MKKIVWLVFFNLLILTMFNNAMAESILTKQQENLVKARVDAMAADNVTVSEKDVIKNRIIDAANKGKAQQLLMNYRDKVDEPWILFSAIMYSSMSKTLCIDYDDNCRMVIAEDNDIGTDSMTPKEEREAETLAEEKLQEIGLKIPKFTN